MEELEKFVKLIPANCPNCGGALQISANTKVTKCPYCGHNVIIQDPTRISVQKNVNIDKLLKLAGISEESENYQDAYTYYSQIIEYEPENVEAWLGKGFTAGMLSSEENIRVREASSYTHQAFELVNKLGLQIDNNLKDLTIRRLDLIALNLKIYLPSYLYQEMINMRPKSVAFQPYQGYLDALILVWEYDPSKDRTEHLIFEISSLIRCAKLVTKWMQNAIYDFQRSDNDILLNGLIAYYKGALQKVRFGDIARKWDENFDLNKIFG